MVKIKQAILIMVHNNLWTLDKILKLLDYEYFDIFIHIDKKSDIQIEDLKNFKMEKSDVFAYKEIDVRWADISQMECELFLINKAFKTHNYKYFHLISGGDMPIRRAEEIFNFFNDSNEEFVHTHDFEEHFNRINNYNILARYRRTSIIFPIINRLFVKSQEILGINRKRNIEDIKTGSNWFSITNKLAEYCVENYEDMLESYRYTLHADEIFLQTLLYNSKFKNNLHGNIPNNIADTMRYIDWERGKPYVFRIDDYYEIINSGALFARKFDENIDKQIIEKLYETLK